MRGFIYGLMFWLMAAGGWILLTFTVDYQEAVACAGVGAITTAFAAAVYMRSRARFAIPEGWVGPVAKLPVKVVSDTGLVMGALFKQIVRGEAVEGEIIQQPFDPGGPNPASATRRAIVEAAVSLTPNSVAIDVDDARRILLIHQLMPSFQPPEGKDPEWPV